jgi:hypothetical protein
LSPEELEQRTTRHFPAATRQQAVEACSTALATLGYEVTFKQLERGIIRTSPKVIVRRAHGYGGHAVASEDALGWAISVTPVDQGVRIAARPRAFRNGRENNIPWVAHVIDGLFRDLWKEIEQMLGSAVSPPKLSSVDAFVSPR